VKEIRSRRGRFLKKDEKSGLYYEVGDAQAREKTSQALRQRAPEMRKLMFGVQPQYQPGGIGSGSLNNMGEDTGGPTPLSSSGAPTTTSQQHGIMTGMTEDQYRWAMESMNQQHHQHQQQQVMGGTMLHGMGGTFNTMMGAAAASAASPSAATVAINGGAGAAALMGATAYNPALLHAMMSGMGSFPSNSAGGTVAIPPTYPHHNPVQSQSQGGPLQGVAGGEGGGGSSGSGGHFESATNI
jgi:hypothetical protein